MTKKTIKGNPRKPRRRSVTVPDDQLVLPEVTCPHCKDDFNIEELQGEWLQRRCPKCATLINEKTCDDQAQDTTSTIVGLYYTRGDLQEPLRQQTRKMASLNRWWQKPYRAILRIKQSRLEKKLEPQISAVDNSLTENRKLLEKQAWNRYYLSEWFLNTHFLPDDDVNNADKTYSMMPVYVINNEKAEFQLIASDMESSGLVGEFMVFEELRNTVSNPMSALFEARILPNLYILKPGKPEESNGSFWHQIDCIVLTRQCAFIIETKRWKSRIKTDRFFKHVYSSRHDIDSDNTEIARDETPYEDSSSILSQNSAHTLGFFDVCKHYHFERLFEMTIFVDPVTFSSAGNDFVDNIYVGQFKRNKSSFTECMERVCLSLKPVVTAPALAKLAADLLNRYGDLNQRTGSIHTERINRNS